MLKDESLKQIAKEGSNVAQFVSFAPNGTQRLSCIRGASPSKRFKSIESAVEAILKTGASFVNIRSFLPEKPEGNPFVMGRKGLQTPRKVAAKASELLKKGYYIIINEEIDERDGGFSGVLLGNVAEFATRDVPRAVEKAGLAVLPRLTLFDFVRVVYNHRINIPYDRSYRVEFSVHPGPVGYAKQNQIIWQIEKTERGREIPEPRPQWPNRVSQDMGDKAYGLLIAHLYGFLVPRTKVFGRFIPTFEFGEETGSPEQCWRRVCPRVQQPGLFTTKHGHVDPFALMKEEDPKGTQIAALIFQDDVEASYSGAAITDGDGRVVIEGNTGHGDDFMVGKVADSKLPAYVKDSVQNVWEKACRIFGPVRFEWCFDRTGTVWIAQFHLGQTASAGNVIYPGKPQRFRTFKVNRGLRAFRSLIEQAKRDGFGIILKGNVGITSHFGDLLWRNEIPSRLERT